jgi:response regulator RpfG family c-di-GMP phosphodiesterase
METHTVIGARILSGSRYPLLRAAEEIALTHHERWDGGGYPRGLKGNDIPVSGRIAAVADVFDSLTHERPYKRAWTVQETLTEIRAESGSRFDPAIVKALLRVAPQARAIAAPDGAADSAAPLTREQLEDRMRALEAERETADRRIEDLRRQLEAAAAPARAQGS